MIDYLINVGLSFLPYLGFGVVIFLITLFAVYGTKFLEVKFESEDQKVFNKTIKVIRFVALGVILAGLVIAFASPVNTFKLEHHNKAQTNSHIERLNSARQPEPVVDMARQPKHTDAERKANFDSLVDYKKDE